MDGWNVRLINSQALELGTVDSRALIVTARGAVTQSTPSVITSVGSSTITAQNVAGNTDYDVTLENTSNDFQGDLILTAANVNVKDTNAIVLGASTVSGNYALTAGDAVTDSGNVTVGGNFSVTTVSYTHLTLPTQA